MAQGPGVVLLRLTRRQDNTSAHHRATARLRRRRRLAESLVSNRLSGDLLDRGYFAADVTVGTPPQRFSLIVDTGSSITALPCADCADRCGEHANPRFRPSSSHTFAPVDCAQHQYGCSSCEVSNVPTESQPGGSGACAYHVAYQEGSTYSGYLVTDVLRLGAYGGACAALRFAFGCATAETGHFQSQRADGIMGLASSRRSASARRASWARSSAHAASGRDGLGDAMRSRSGGLTDFPFDAGGPLPPATLSDLSAHAQGGYSPTMLEALVAQGIIADGFSLCIGRDGGVLSFGLPAVASVMPASVADVATTRRRHAEQPAPTASPLMWVPVVDAAYYSIRVGSLLYGAAVLSRGSPTSTILGEDTSALAPPRAARLR